MRLIRPLSMRGGVSIFLLALGSTTALADPIALPDPNLSGSVQYDGWLKGSLTTAANPGFPGFPGSSVWPGPIGSSAAGSADANLNKVANGNGGGPYPAGDSIYFGGFSADVNNQGGTLSVTDATPVSGLENVAFEIQIGEAWTYDFWNHALPTLSYNGGSQALAATGTQLLEQYFNGTVTMPTGEEPVYINSYLLQWDLSSIVGPITSFAITFTGVQHSQLYALRLDQSNQFTPVQSPARLSWPALAVSVCLPHGERVDLLASGSGNLRRHGAPPDAFADERGRFFHGWPFAASPGCLPSKQARAAGKSCVATRSRGRCLGVRFAMPSSSGTSAVARTLRVVMQRATIAGRRGVRICRLEPVEPFSR